MQPTNGGEIAAFVVARVITIAIIYAVSMMFLSALYLQLYRSVGAATVAAVGFGVMAAGWLITLVLFLLFRAAFGGVPPAVAAPAEKNAVTTSGGEIGAFAIAALIVMVAVSLVNTYVIVGLYRWMRANGYGAEMALVSIGISAGYAVVFFLIFIALRNVMAGPARRGDAVGSGWR